MSNKTVPVTLLTGYLGSGKTTLVNKILANNQGFKIAVIVNDIGEINVDASLIQAGGFVNKKDDSLVALSNGCICCTLKTDLIDQITGIIETGRFDYILIEASGICEPLPIAQTITAISGYARQYNQPEPCRLDCIATVVDALRMAREFANGNSLTRDNIDDDDIENLLIQQIEFCNIIILNKIDEITEDEKKQVKAVIKKLQPYAEIVETNYAELDLSKIMDSHKFDFEKASISAGWVAELEKEEEEEPEGETEEYGIGTYVYYRRKAFNYTKFETYVNDRWPNNIIRSKGICYFSDDADMSYMFDQAGMQKKLVKAGQWICTAPIEEQRKYLAESEELRKDWDDEYGDRMIKIVFIGQNLDREQIKADMDKI
ncbi:MAG: GTP-binding protein [Salinivirgaceae bacterium]|nr:GTP-binding protein [Salinivirgaceae bacterium]MBR5167954.1 GTP-binding protein [Salinivirgaceae bacterium]